jgi:hypothetical protein
MERHAVDIFPPFHIPEDGHGCNERHGEEPGAAIRARSVKTEIDAGRRRTALERVERGGQ